MEENDEIKFKKMLLIELCFNMLSTIICVMIIGVLCMNTQSRKTPAYKLT